jgi:DNA-binding winged helix-turn-helix (wHTH) protein/TolB-like protein/Tfp pilus assembly protein PilF
MMTEEQVRFYEFGRFRVDVGQRVLRRESEVVPLTPKVFDILLVLVEGNGRIVEKDELMRRVWPDSFVEEGNLTQNISLLRKALGEGSNGQQFVETIARRGYRFVAEVRQSSETTAAAAGNGARPGAHNSVTPEHLQKSQLETRLTKALGSGRRRAAAAIALTIIALAVFYFSRGGKVTDAGSATLDSIAVLPFANDSADDETEYLNDRITESVINSLSSQLTNIPESQDSDRPRLRVTPRANVLVYKGQQVDPAKVGADLKVSVVLTGRVQRRGDMLSIQADLIDVATKSQIWGQHYERKVADLLLVQDDIAKDIFDNLRLKLSVEEKKHLDAYRSYLKGRNYWNKRTTEELRQAIEHFQRAIELDPGYASAYAGLADSYNMLVVYGVRRPHDAFPAAKQAAERALEIDDTLAEAHTSLAFIKFRWDWDRLDAERGFKLAIWHKPNYAPAHQWYSSYLAAFGRFDEAIEEAKKAQRLETPTLITDSHIGWILYLAGRQDEAIEQCQKLLEIDPTFFPARRYLGLAYEEKGLYDKAVAEFQRAKQLSGSPLIVALLGHAYAVSGKHGEAKQVLAELREIEAYRYVSPYTVAAIHAGLGDRDEAFRWLERAYEERDIWLMNLKVDPALRPLRTDPRFKDLSRRVGLDP